MKRLAEISNEDIGFINPQYGRKIRQIILEEDIFYRFDKDIATKIDSLKYDINKTIVNSYSYMRHMYETVDDVSLYPQVETILDWFTITGLYFYESLYHRVCCHFVFNDGELPTPAEVETVLTKLYLLEKEVGNDH